MALLTRFVWIQLAVLSSILAAVASDSEIEIRNYATHHERNRERIEDRRRSGRGQDRKEYLDARYICDPCKVTIYDPASVTSKTEAGESEMLPLTSKDFHDPIDSDTVTPVRCRGDGGKTSLLEICKTPCVQGNTLMFRSKLVFDSPTTPKDTCRINPTETLVVEKGIRDTVQCDCHCRWDILWDYRFCLREPENYRFCSKGVFCENFSENFNAKHVERSFKNQKSKEFIEKIGVGSIPVFKCPGSQGSPDMIYEPSVILFAFGQNITESFDCSALKPELPMKERCVGWKAGDREDVCVSGKCHNMEVAPFRQQRGAHSSPDYLLFERLYDYYYDNTNDCSNMREGVRIQIEDPNEEYEINHGPSSCGVISKTDYAGPRLGCATALWETSKSPCYVGLMGQRCLNCYNLTGLTGDKCQFYNECELQFHKRRLDRNVSLPEIIETHVTKVGKEWMKNPCGISSKESYSQKIETHDTKIFHRPIQAELIHCLPRPNGKYCLCEEGKLDGFYNIYTDRVKDPILSPAGEATYSNMRELRDQYSINETARKWYHFFIEMAPFHSYYGCKIEDPCYKMMKDKKKGCVHGTTSLINLVNTSTPGFQSYRKFTHGAIEVSDDFGCKCTCDKYHYGPNCKYPLPCVEYQEKTRKKYCGERGTCTHEDEDHDGSKKEIMKKMKCECEKRFFGKRCEFEDLCLSQLRCNKDTDKKKACNPCKNGADCIRDTKDQDNGFRYFCNCTTNFVGKDCECPKGEITNKEEFSASLEVEVNAKINFDLEVKDPSDDKNGKDTFVLVSFSDKQQNPDPVSSSKNHCPQGQRCFHFSHQYTKVGTYTVTANLTQCQEYVTDSVTKEITVIPPEGFRCFPNISLSNVVNRDTDTAAIPVYPRNKEIHVHKKLESSCKDVKVDYDYHWKLEFERLDEKGHLKKENMHINETGKNPPEKIHVSRDQLKFEAYSLAAGTYFVHVYIVLKIKELEPKEAIAEGSFTVEMLAPEIDIEGGEERTVDIYKEVVLDASNSKDLNYEDDPSRLNFKWSCSDCPIGAKSHTGSVWKIPPGTLKFNLKYEFHLDVESSDNPLQKSAKNVTLIGAGASLKIDCEEQCDLHIPGQKVLHQCLCEGCKSQPNLTWSWEPATDVVEFTEIPGKKSFINVALPHLKAEDVAIRQIVCRAETEGLIAKHELEVSRPPKIGKCSVNPREGIYLVTEFSLECADFDRDSPARYSFYAEVADKSKIGMHLNNRYLLSHDNVVPDAKRIYLPAGNPMKILVQAENSDGLSNTVEFSAAVNLPNPQNLPEILDKLMLEEDSVLNRMKNMGDYQKALQIQLVVLHGLLQEPIDNIFSGIGSEKIEALRAMMSEVFGKVNNTMEDSSEKTIEQTVNTVYLWYKWDESADSVDTNSEILFQAASRLATVMVEQSEHPIPHETVEILARAGTDASARILKRSVSRGAKLLSMERIRPGNERLVTDYDKEDEISREYFSKVHELDETGEEGGLADVDQSTSSDVQKFAVVSHRAMRSMEHFLDAVGSRLSVGERFEEKTDEVAVSSWAFMSINETGLPINVTTALDEKVGVQISGSLSQIMKDNNIKHVEIQVIESKINPFFDDDSAKISTPVVSLQIKDGTPGKGRPLISLSEVSKPFELRMRMTPTSQEHIERAKIFRTEELRPLESFDESDTEPIYITLAHNTRWKITLLDYPTGIEFSVAVRKDYWPRKHDYCDPTSSKVLNDENKYSASFDTEPIGLNEEPEERLLEYFIGIFPYDVASTGLHRHINFSVYLMRTSCVFRDEDKKIWSEEGCVVGNDSTPTALHCICDHASVFAGTHFAIPNKLQSFSIFDFDYEAFSRNPVVLTTVCVLLALYIILMGICWILDRLEKKRHIGITIMADVAGDSSQSYYLISVRTDSRFGAGTTANVCMQIYGTNGRSQVFTLKEKEMPVLNRGGSDTYLVASKKSLGKIEKIRVWHDNTGMSPTWFCRRVVITDVQSSIDSYFYVYRWLHVSGSESTVVFEQNAASEADHTKFSRRYKENVSDQLDNSHLWLSILRFPASSCFTRCQRLTCAFGILASYLIMNIMFYGIELQDADDVFGLQTYIVASQMSLLSAPFGIILIALFRRIRQRYIPTLIIWRNMEMRKRLQETGATIFVPQQQKIVKEPVHRHAAFGDHNQTMMDRVTSAADRADSDASSNFSIPSTNIEDLEAWLEFDVAPKMASGSFDRTILARRVDERVASDVNDHIALGRLGLIRAVRAMDSSSFVFTGDNSIPEVERLIDQEIRDHLNYSRRPQNFTLPADMVPVQNIPDYHSAHQQAFFPDEDFFSDDDEEENTQETVITASQPEPQTLTFETCKMAPQAKAFCYLPWWFIFIAWFLAIGVIVVCLYFTLLYGLAYGYERSVDWLLGVVFSFFLSLLIIQPIQVFVVSFFMTIFCRSRQWSIIQEERFQILIKDQDDLKGRKPLAFRLFQPSRKYAPLSGHEILRLKVKARSREKLKNGVVKLFFYLLLLIPLSVVAHWGQNRNNFLLVENLRNSLQLKDGQKFQAVNNNEDLYNYLKKILIPTLHPEKLYNDARIILSRYDPVFLQDGQNILVGVARIRQLRVVESACHLPAYKCYGRYSIDKQDTASYNPRWQRKPASDKSTSPESNDIWKFNSVVQPKKPKKGDFPFVPSIVQRGDLGVYYGGGYVAELGRKTRESRSVIRHMELYHWIDQRTRVVFIEFTITNPNVQIYTDVVLKIEMSPSQAFECSYNIHPVTRKLSRTDDEGEDQTHWLEICYVAIFICTIVLIVNFVKNIIEFPDVGQIVYQTSLWVDFITIVGLFVSLGLAVKQHLVFFDALKLVDDMKVNQYINLQELVYWSETETAAFSILLSICFFKIFRILIHIDERFRVMALTLKMSGKMLGAYAFVLFIVLIAFASSGNFLFGNEMKEFRTFGHSVVSLIDQIVSVDFFEELSTYNRFLGPIYSFLFGFLVVFMSMNLLIAVLSQAHYEAKLVSREGREEASLLGNVCTVVGDCCSQPKEKGNVQGRPLFELQPHRLEGMKKETLKFLEDNLKSSKVRKLNEMKNHMNSILKGTGFRMVSNVCRRRKEEQMKEADINKMRQITADFLRKKLGTEMTVQEFRTYADTNREYMNLRLQKLEELLEIANDRLNDLLDVQ